MFRPRHLLAFAVMTLATGLSAGPLRFSGILGQSQVAGTKPFVESCMRGAAITPDGALWSFCGPVLCKITVHDEVPVLQKTFNVYGNKLYSNGNLLYFESAGQICSFNPVTETAKKEIALPGNTVAFCQGVAPYAFLALTSNAVSGLTGGKWQKLFDIPVEKGRNYSIIIDPESGDILVGSEYPTMKIKRFTLSGQELRNSSWPRDGHSNILTIAAGKAWALSNMAISLPAVYKSESEIRRIGGEWTSPVTGLAVDARGRYWLATDQGILGYDRLGRPLDIRIGGINGIRHMAVTENGDLYAAVSDRMVRLPIDALPSQPLTCRESKFRFGDNYQTHVCGLYRDTQQFFVLDEVKKMLWQFKPAQIPTYEKTWFAMTEPNSFTDPKAMTGNAEKLFIIDRDTIISAPLSSPKTFSPLTLDQPRPGMKFLAVRDNRLFVASADSVTAFRLEADGKAVRLWDIPGAFKDISGFAAGTQYLVISEKSSGTISLLSLDDGRIFASIEAKDIPGGIIPGAACIMEPWIFIYDDKGKRIVRLKLERR